MNGLSLIVVLLVLATSGCERSEPAERSPDATRARAAEPAMEQAEQCINRIKGYAVAYPAGWHTNPGGDG